MTQSVQLEVPASVTRKLASARVAQVSREPSVMSVRMDTGTWMENLGASSVTVTQNMLSTTSVTRLVSCVYIIIHTTNSLKKRCLIMFFGVHTFTLCPSRSQASVCASQSMEAENVTSVGRITLETPIYSACVSY